MTTDEMGSRYYGIPEPHERTIPDYVGAIADEPDDWRQHRTRPENGGDCAAWAVALLLWLVVFPVAVTAVFVWRVG